MSDPVGIIMPCILGGLLFTVIGFYMGAGGKKSWEYERGRALGWQEGYFRRNDDEQAKRDKQGRFSGKDSK